MKIFILTTNDYQPDTFLVTTDLNKAKEFVSEKEIWVFVWENEKEIDSLDFEGFKEKY